MPDTRSTGGLLTLENWSRTTPLSWSHPVLFLARPPVHLPQAAFNRFGQAWDGRSVGVSVLAGVNAFFRYSKASRVCHAVLIFDAARVGLFAVTGAGKALVYGLGPIPAALPGMVTGTGEA